MTETKQNILSNAKSLFAKGGYEAVSARKLAEASDTGISSVYHFFSDKDAVLHELFHSVGSDLGQKRSLLPDTETASDMLWQRIRFQFDNIEDVVFVLKYYMHFRNRFKKTDSGFIPARAYQHIQEALARGVEAGEFEIDVSEIEQQAKMLTHATNGFLLEFYPLTPENDELDSLVSSIHQFLMRGLTLKEAAMK